MKFLVTIITGFILFASCKENKKNNEVIKQDKTVARVWIHLRDFVSFVYGISTPPDLSR